MISHIGRVSLEAYKTVKGIQREEIEGEMTEKEVEVTLRFDYVIPIGSPYDLTLEVLEDIKKEVEEMRAKQQKAQRVADNEEESADAEVMADKAGKEEDNCDAGDECES